MPLALLDDPPDHSVGSVAACHPITNFAGGRRKKKKKGGAANTKKDSDDKEKKKNAAIETAVVRKIQAAVTR